MIQETVEENTRNVEDINQKLKKELLNYYKKFEIGDAAQKLIDDFAR